MKLLAFIITLCCICCSCVNDNKPFESPNLTAKEAIENAHTNAGGDFWKNAKSLTLRGYANFYNGKDTLKNETYNMSLVFPRMEKANQTIPDKIKLESLRDGHSKIHLAYDGEYTYDIEGKHEITSEDSLWFSSLGYGFLRHALNEDYSISISGEGMVKHKNTCVVKITTHSNNEIFYDITFGDFKIAKVAFDTPRGWHHRLYSEFFEKEEYNWVQPRVVEHYYNDKKTHEVIWEDFDVNKTLSDSLFVVDY